MAKGSFSGTYQYWTIRTDWSSTTNTLENSSTVIAKHYLECDAALQIGSRTHTCNFGGDSKNFTSSSIKTTGEHYLGTTTHTIAHDESGTKSVTAKTTFKMAATLSGVYVESIVANSGTITLDDIPRQATLSSATNFTDEENPTITYTNLAGNSVDALQACIKDSTGATILIPYRDIDKTGSSYTFTLTDDERDILRNHTPNNNQVYVNFCVKTVIGDDSYVSDLTRILTIVNADPTVTGDIIDINSITTALTGDPDVFIKEYSTAKYTLQSTALKGATLTRYRVYCGTRAETHDVEDVTAIDVTDTLTKSITSANFSLRAYDSRGNETTKSIPKTLIDYVKLTCNLTGNNPTAEGDMSFIVHGNYFNGLFGNEGTARANTLALAYRYKENNGEYSGWTTIAPTITNNTYSCTVNLTDLNYQSTYTVQARAVDLLNTDGISSAEKKVKSTPVFDWGENDFTVNGELIANNKITANGDIIANGNIVYQPNVMTVGLDSTKSVEITSTTFPNSAPLSTSKLNYGDKLSQYSGGIQIAEGSGVRYVRVGANIMIQGIASVNYVRLMHWKYDGSKWTSETIMQGYQTANSATDWEVISFSPQVRAVSEKDYFSISVGSSVTGTLKIAAGTYSHLTVEVVS